MKDTIDYVEELRGQLEAEAERIGADIAAIERVVALIKARPENKQWHAQELGRNGKSSIDEPPAIAPPSQSSDTFTQAIWMDALAEAGDHGLTPRELKQGIGLDDTSFKVFVAKQLAAGTICRIGQRGPGVRYKLTRLPAAVSNGSMEH